METWGQCRMIKTLELCYELDRAIFALGPTDYIVLTLALSQSQIDRAVSLDYSLFRIGERANGSCSSITSALDI